MKRTRFIQGPLLRAGLLALTTTSLAAPAFAAGPAVSPLPVSDTTDSPLRQKAPKGAPNVVVVLLDDVGFGATSAFGGPVATPALERLAGEGLRYNRFHTTSICSPTRASLLTGRNPHAVHMGAVMNTADDRPGYTGFQTKDAVSVAEILRRAGYNTAAFGKWHQTPDSETSPNGPFDRWPTGQGFERFYGFIGGETDQFEPTLFEGTRQLPTPNKPGYHLTTDLADQAIAWLNSQNSVEPDRPAFLYFAPGAAHAPLQPPKDWIDRYKGQFDGGWDALRVQILNRQKKLGVVPADTVLTPRPDGMPAWNTLSADDKKIAARLMETYAAFLAHTDYEVGRLVQSLKDSGQYDNTMFIYIVGDNGGSPEGGLDGSINYMGKLQGVPEDRAKVLARLDEIGNADTYAHYNTAWAWALNSPFQWTKTVASHLGGTRNPMVITWPKGITDKGGLRSQFGHVNDIAPTILEAAGVPVPGVVDGIRQMPMNGTSLVYSFKDAKAAERHTTQYFEVFGHRAIYHDGWMASAFHNRAPWATGMDVPEKPFDQDRWELYDLRKDYSQSKDLAAKYPAKLDELKALFMTEAAANQVLPLGGPTMGDPNLPSLTGKRTAFTYYPGTVGVPEAGAPKMMNRSWDMNASLEVPANGSARGVVATIGGTAAGWSLYLDGEGKPKFTYRLFETKTVDLAGTQPLAPGKHTLQVAFDYDGGGWGKGGNLRFLVDGQQVGEERLPASPPAFFSISETFDVGVDTGSAAGKYPADAAIGYPFAGGTIDKVDIKLR